MRVITSEQPLLNGHFRLQSRLLPKLVATYITVRTPINIAGIH